MSAAAQRESQYNELAEAFRKDLAPQGLIENLLATEIINAAWRLLRCTNAEASLYTTELDPMLDPAKAAQQSAIDQFRAQAHRILHRSIADLRRIQTDRLVREAVVDEAEAPAPIEGLANYRDRIAVLRATTRLKMDARRLRGTDTIEKLVDQPIPQSQQNARQTENWLRSAETPNTPRNGPCPCGSGEKFKRCCGKTAPPVLHPGIPKAA